MFLSLVYFYAPLIATASGSFGGVNWTAIILAILGILGSGGLVTLYRAIKNQGIKEVKQDELVAILPQLKKVITVVLGDGKDQKGISDIVDLRFVEITKELRGIKDNQTPNGGYSKSLGDTVKRADDTGQRVEKAVGLLSDKLSEHIGQAAVIDKLNTDRITSVEDRVITLEKKS